MKNDNCSIIRSLYSIRSQGIKIWRDNGKIKIKSPAKVQLQESQRSFLKNNKDEVLNILEQSRIHSEKDSNKILRYNGNKGITSYGAQRLYFIDKFEGSTNYNSPLILRLKGSISYSSLEHAFNAVIQKNGILRTKFFESEDGTIFQEILPYSNYFQISLKSELKNRSEIHYEIDNGLKHKFDLSSAKLINVQLFKEKETEDHILFINQHHIVADEWSIELFIDEISNFYNQALKGDVGIEENSIRYLDFSIWQREFLTENIINEKINYWKKELDNLPELDLYTDKKRPKTLKHNGAVENVKIEYNVLNEVKHFCKENNLTLNSFFMGVFYFLLSKYTSQNDLVIGIPIANRPNRQLEKLLGFFVNTLPIRISFNDNDRISAIFENINNKNIEIQDYREVPFDYIVRSMNIERSSNKNPLFQVMFIYVEEKAENKEEFSGLKFEYEEHSNISSKFDIMLTTSIADDHFKILVEYDTDLFYKSTISNFIKYYVNIINEIISGKELYKEVNICREDDFKLLEAWNDTKFYYDKNLNFVDLFEKAAGEFPEKEAVVHKDKSINYEKFNSKINRLSNHITSNNIIKTDDIIAIMCKPGIEMILSIIAALKSGTAFLPIDIKLPKERIKYILNDAKPKLIFTQTEVLKNEIAEIQSEISSCEIVDVCSEENYKCSDNKPECTITQDSLAYVIYTSGSTGIPKGVMQVHKTLTNGIYWHNNDFNVTPDDRMAKYVNIAFDVSIAEIFPILAIGGTLVIAPDDLRLNLIGLSQYYETKKVSIAHFPTAVFEEFIELENSSLTKVVVAGDALKKFQKKNYEVFNGYGPTETYFASTFHVTKHYNNIPIGKPILNYQFYIMDRNQNLCPAGIPGEIYIGGDGLARGYLNNEKTTREKFIFCEKLSKRLYRTGDKARWLSDGNVEFLGRFDFQVKIRGYRIELQEIENSMLKIEGIKDVSVIVKDLGENNKILCAFYTGSLEDIELIKERLSEFLPEYMIPQFFRILDKMPLTPNGKINRKELQSYEIEYDKEDYVPPETEMEKKLTEIWEKVLNLDKVSITDNFFNIGGDSIKSIQIQNLANRNNINIKTIDIFDNKTIQLISRKISGKKAVITKKKDESGHFPLLPVQTWFFNLNFKNHDWFNQSILLDIESVNLENLNETVKIIQTLKGGFRLRFEKNNDNWQQYYVPVNQFHPEELEIISFDSDEMFDAEVNSIQSSLNIKKGKLYRFVLLTDNKSRSHLFIVLHHLITDGITLRILMDDISEIYNTLESGRNESLELKEYEELSSYKDWVCCLKHYTDSISDNQKTFWKGTKENYPFDGKVLSYKEACTASFQFDEEFTENLKNSVVSDIDTKLKHILLTALISAYSEVKNVDSITLLLEGHGREDILDNIDISNTIGWFTAMYPFQVKLPEKQFLNNEVRFVKLIEKEFERLPENGLTYSLLQEFSEAGQNLLDLKSIPLSFNYLGEFQSGSSNEWKISEYFKGYESDMDNPMHLPLYINGSIVNNKLSINFMCSPAFLDNDDLKKLAESMKNNISSISNKSKTNKIERFQNNFIPLTEFNSLGQYGPLIFIHPGTMGIEAYYDNLVKLMPEDIRLFLLDHYPIKTGATFSSIQELADKYVEFILSKLAFGPFYIGGWCLGAAVAIEVAEKLRLLGENVQNIFLVDPIVVSDETRNKYFVNSEYKDDVLVNYKPSLKYSNKATLFKCNNVLFHEDSRFTAMYEEAVKQPYNNLENNLLNLNKVDLQCHHDEVVEDKFMKQIVESIDKIIKNNN